MTIKVITYEEERLHYFIELMGYAQRRYNRLFEKYKDANYLSHEFEVLSDAGRELQFISEVVEMLKQGNQKQNELIRCKDCEYFKEYTTEYMQRVEKANGDCHLRLINRCLGGEQFCGCKYDDFCSLAKQKVKGGAE